jgi:hypothetical protein
MMFWFVSSWIVDHVGVMKGTIGIMIGWMSANGMGTQHTTKGEENNN